MMSIWDVLGIPFTRDQAVIKRAYAARLKETRPGDDREGFLRLRQAYETARGGQIVPSQPSQTIDRPPATMTVANDNPATANNDANRRRQGDRKFAVRDRSTALAPAPAFGADDSVGARRNIFLAAYARRDTGAAIGAFEAAMNSQCLSLADEMAFTDRLLDLLQDDLSVPIAKLRELANRFDWHRVTGARHSRSENARIRICQRIDAEIYASAALQDAESEDPRLLFQIALHLAGEGIQQNTTEAIRLLKLAIEMGHADSANALGVLYMEGRGIEPDHAEGRRYYEIAAAKGHSDAQRCLAHTLAAGRGGPVDHVTALKWFRAAAEQGDLAAMYHVGWSYLNGRGVEQNVADAVFWLSKAASAGQSSAMYALGGLYRRGKGVEPNIAEAVRLFKLATQMGHAKSANDLGTLYMNGEGVQRDQAEGRRYYEIAAEKGLTDAQRRLAHAFVEGHGGPVDRVAAFKWFLAAAEQGDPSGMNGVGYSYLNGLGVQQNIAEGVLWLSKAADAGQPNAMQTLGALHLYGKRIPRDIETAYRWFVRALRAYKSTNEKVGPLRELLGNVATLIPAGRREEIDAELANAESARDELKP
jgi:uncharacterized protein